jgi:hypothetical protein
MPVNLLALCGDPGESIVKRVRISASVQGRLSEFFETLEIGFRDGVEIERAYDSRWTPGAEEVITLPINSEAADLLSRLDGGVLGLEEINGDAFDGERIRALAVQQTGKLLLQVFGLSQRLSKKMAFIANSNTFDKIDRSAFMLSNHIDVIVESGLIKFKNFNTAKRIFDLSSHYKEATDSEIRSFSQSPILQVDADALVALATQPMRKLISSVQSSGILERESAESISRKAAGLVPVEVQGSKIVLPMTRRELKDLMAFLDHKIYRSPVDDDPYETNSHRRRG